MGVFATRSPFRPNPIGLSSVTLEEVRLHTPEGPVLVVGGADLMDGTPIYDIKPYLPYADCHPDATGGFAEESGALRAGGRLSGGAGSADRAGASARRCAACWRTTRGPLVSKRSRKAHVRRGASRGRTSGSPSEDGVLTVRKIEEDIKERSSLFQRRPERFCVGAYEIRNFRRPSINPSASDPARRSRPPADAGRCGRRAAPARRCASAGFPR